MPGTDLSDFALKSTMSREMFGRSDLFFLVFHRETPPPQKHWSHLCYMISLKRFILCQSVSLLPISKSSDKSANM